MNWILCITYILVILGMYCIVLLIDEILGPDDRWSKHKDGWGLAIAWPLLLMFVLLMFVTMCCFGWYWLITKGTEGFITAWEKDKEDAKTSRL